MKLLAALLLLSVSAFSTTVTTTINTILHPEATETEYLVLANDGSVYGIEMEDTEMVSSAFAALENNSEVTLSFNDNFKSLTNKRSMLKSIERTIDVTKAVVNNVYSDITPLNNYRVTSLKSMDDAKKLFREMRRDTRNRSQCYNRSHVWTYEFTETRRLDAGKVWIYFTPKYIKEYKYKWWFHTAPYFEVNTESEKVVMDRKFSSKPQRLTTWKNVYMKNNANCPTITKYSQYDNHRYSNWCYLMFSSKYYWQPHNFKALEAEAIEKRAYKTSEVNAAYKNAIKRSGRRRRDEE